MAILNFSHSPFPSPFTVQCDYGRYAWLLHKTTLAQSLVPLSVILYFLRKLQEQRIRQDTSLLFIHMGMSYPRVPPLDARALSFTWAPQTFFLEQTILFMLPRLDVFTSDPIEVFYTTSSWSFGFHFEAWVALLTIFDHAQKHVRWKQTTTPKALLTAMWACHITLVAMWQSHISSALQLCICMCHTLLRTVQSRRSVPSFCPTIWPSRPLLPYRLYMQTLVYNLQAFQPNHLQK